MGITSDCQCRHGAGASAGAADRVGSRHCRTHANRLALDTARRSTARDAVGNGKIKNYLIEYSMDGSSWDDLATIGRKE